MEKTIVRSDHRHEFLFNTIFANKNEFLSRLLFKSWSKVIVMEPVLALIAFNHKVISIKVVMRLLAIAI